MKRSTLEVLCCPSCRAGLALRGECADGSVEDGGLFCPSCDRNFPIKNGIARFVAPEELEGLNRRLARFYNRFSQFDAIFGKVFFLPMGGERKARKAVLDRLEPNGGRMLEVSIGSGGNLAYLFESRAVGDMCGVDISVAQLARCRDAITKHGWPVDLFLGTAEALPFRERSFDSVFHIGGINFFSGKKEAIDEMIRVARPGSRIVIADECERAARLIARVGGFSRLFEGRSVDTSVPVQLVPPTMEEIRVDGIWKMHGQYHGYCLEFRRPA
jgi:uncharacterized protein YbaR (Trm112 family)